MTTSTLLAIIAIVAPVFTLVIVGLLAWSMNQTMGRVNDRIDSVQGELEDHKSDCNKVDKNVLESRQQITENEVGRLRSNMHWIINSLSVIGAHMKIQLPERPH